MQRRSSLSLSTLALLCMAAATVSACADDTSGTAQSGLELGGPVTPPAASSGTQLPSPQAADPAAPGVPAGEPDPGGTSLYSRTSVYYFPSSADVQLEDGATLQTKVEDRRTFSKGWWLDVDAPTLREDFRGTITADGAAGERWGVKILRFTAKDLIDADAHDAMELVPPYDSVTIEDDAVASWSATDPTGAPIAGATELSSFVANGEMFLVACVPLWIPGPEPFAGTHSCTLHIAR